MKLDDIRIFNITYIPEDGVFTGTVRLDFFGPGILEHDTIAPAHRVDIDIRTRLDRKSAFSEVEADLKVKAAQLLKASIIALETPT